MIPLCQSGEKVKVTPIDCLLGLHNVGLVNAPRMGRVELVGLGEKVTAPAVCTFVASI